MDKSDLIPLVGVGGALALILYIASRNRNAADTGYMPYGWGSFQNGNNPVTPVNPAIPPNHGVTLPVIVDPPPSVESAGMITAIPVQPKPMVINRLWNPASIRSGIRPVMGRKVI